MANTTFMSNTFVAWSMKHLAIDMDGSDLVVHVPDQRGTATLSGGCTKGPLSQSHNRLFRHRYIF